MENLSTRMNKTNKISDVIQKNELDKIGNLDKNIYHKRLFIRCSAEEFGKLVRLKGERIFREAGDAKDFEIDDNNRDVFNQLFYYAIGSDKFNGDLRKGLWLWSAEFGTGKTTALMIMNELFNEFNKKHFPFINCKTLHNKVTDSGIEYFSHRNICLDDIKREMKLINYWGNKIKPIPSIIHLREHYGSWTHATCQNQIIDLNDTYGKVSTNRMIKMFNEIEFKGKTRRK